MEMVESQVPDRIEDWLKEVRKNADITIKD
jgi:hypothetical protein